MLHHLIHDHSFLRITLRSLSTQTSLFAQKPTKMAFIVNTENEKEVSILGGETAIGRGPYLCVKEPSLSRCHALLHLSSNGKLSVKPTHINPTYLYPSTHGRQQQLLKDQWTELRNGDHISLMPDSFRFRIKLNENVGTEDGIDSKRKAPLGSSLRPCPYGNNCYRENPAHFSEYSHRDIKENEKPICEYGSKCYRRGNPCHNQMFTHQRSPPESGEGVIPNAANENEMTKCVDSCQEIRVLELPEHLEDGHGIIKKLKVSNTDARDDADDAVTVQTRNKGKDEGWAHVPGVNTAHCEFIDKVSCNITKPEKYDPSEVNYHPIENACWRYGEEVPYLALARTFEQVENISARLKTISVLCNFFRSVILLKPDELLPCIYLCINQVAPSYEGVELGIGESTIMKALCSATGMGLKEIKAQLSVKGDVGIVAERLKSSQNRLFQPTALTVSGVFRELKQIAATSDMARKQEKIKSIFVASSPLEAKYLFRSFAGKLRIGLAEQSVLVALGNAVVLSPPGQQYPPTVLNTTSDIPPELKKEMAEAVRAIKTAYAELPSYEIIVKNLLESGWRKLGDKCHLTPGVPLKPMLAHPIKGMSDVLKKFDDNVFACEYKYDGERAQIHLLPSGEVEIFIRNLENNTSKYPDIVSRIPTVIQPHVTSCIIDTESVAWDREKKQILPFQVLSTRKRKDVEWWSITVDVCVYAFDLLYVNGESLVGEPFRRRRELLRRSFKEFEGKFVYATSMISGDTDEISQFLEESIEGSCEGLMIKTLDTDATYEIAKRSRNWLKLKKDYMDGVGDTFDLVVLGGYLGTGKRTGKYGGFLLACHDEVSCSYQSICKTGSGFTDDQLIRHYKSFRNHIIDKPHSCYNCGDVPEPDHWFDAVQVWEIKAADLSISPIYKAGIGIVDPSRGISLRFPRFLRTRDDKKVQEATSSRQIAEFYKNQQQINKAN